MEGGSAGRGSTGSRTGAVLSTVPGNAMPDITTRPLIPLGLLSSVVRASDPRLGEGKRFGVGVRFLVQAQSLDSDPDSVLRTRDLEILRLRSDIGRKRGGRSTATEDRS